MEPTARPSARTVWEQVDLETLVLADNDLTEVSTKIGNLKCLRMLDLGHNTLQSLPESLGDLEALSDFLYLHDNRLTSLTRSLARLKQLRYLNISEDAFEALPNVFAGCTASSSYAHLTTRWRRCPILSGNSLHCVNRT